MNRLQQMNLNGKVKSVCITSRSYKGAFSGGSSDSSTYHFDESGMLTKSESINYINRRSSRSEDIYDENEKLIKRNSFNNEVMEEITIYRYHPKGNLALVERLGTGKLFPSDTDELNEKHITRFDLNGNIIESIKSRDGVILSRSVLNYDENRNVLERIDYEKDDKLSSKESFTYDENGKIIEKYTVCNDEYTTTISKVLKTYDTQGRVIESSTFSKEGPDKEVLEKNWLLRSTDKYTYTSDVELRESTCFQYDENDQLIDKHISLNETGIRAKPSPKPKNEEEIRCEYEYDDKNNWIKKSEFSGNSLRNTEDREITYYE